MTRMHVDVHWCHWPMCIRVIYHWSMTRMHRGKWHECTCAFVTLTDVHSCHLPVVNDTNAHGRALVSLTNVHWCHWPSYEEKEKSLGVSIPFIDQCVFVSLTSSEHLCNRQVCIWHCKKCKYTIKEFLAPYLSCIGHTSSLRLWFTAKALAKFWRLIGLSK